MSNRRIQNTSNLQKKQNSNISSSQYQNTTPQEDLRKAIIHNFSSNQFQTTFNNLNSKINNTMDNSRGSPFLTNHYSNSANETPNPLLENTITPIICDTSGNHPLPRFGQSLVSITPVKILLFGGAVGDVKNFNLTNEIYIINLMTRIWSKIKVDQNKPLPKERAAHAASTNNDNQMIIHGGSIGGHLLAEDEIWLFTLRNDNDQYGNWKKIITQNKGPGKRYGHTLNYLKPFFILFGGSCNNQLLNDVWIIDIKIQNPNWIQIDFKNNLAPSPRLYQTCGFCDKGDAKGMMIVFGGRDSNENPLNDIWGLILHRDGTWSWKRAPITDNELIKPRYNHSVVFDGSLMIIIGGRGHINQSSPLPIQVYDTSKNDVFNFPGVGMNRHSSFILDKYIYLYGGFNDKNQIQPIGNLSKISMEKLFQNSPLSRFIGINNNGNNNQNNNFGNNNNKKSKFKLSQNVVIGAGGIINENEENEIEDMTSIFKKVNINKLQEENKRLGENFSSNKNPLMQSVRPFNYKLINNFIDTLLRPFDWFDNSKMDEIHKTLPFLLKDIYSLIKEVKPILESEKSLIKIRSPCKIFGNIYGDYNGLMRFFESFGNPSDDNQNGDINTMQYIFLGDFCDRCYYSLENILLLFALKVKYPEFIYLIRGHHEDIQINFSNGLGDECKERLDDDISKNKSLFYYINQVFNLLPFGVLIDDSILCIHGGIGSRVNSIIDIENIKRPVKVNFNVSNKEEQIILDLLYSEYSDEIDDVEPNRERKEGKGFIVNYGKERLNKFLLDNKINLLITSHKFCKEGVMSFNDDRLLQIFSASNYYDKYNNLGGMIIIGKKTKNKPINIIPRLINANENTIETYRKDIPSSPIKQNQ